nr:amidohydrolase family protein [Sphingomonas colocasiae]
MPGLVDMHVHLPDAVTTSDGALRRSLALMIGYGVTTARVMQAPAVARDARSAVEQGALAGPRLYVAAPIVNDDTAPTVAAGRAAVRSAADGRYDLVKAHQLTHPTVWHALIDEARAVALPVAGHVDNAVGLPAALAAGQEVEHLDGAIQELLPKRGAGLGPFAQVPPAAVVAAASAAGPARIDGLARRVAKARSFQVPTLASFERAFDPAPDALAADTAACLADAEQRRTWPKRRDAMRQAMPADAATTFLRLRRAIAAAYARAGVRIMAGSDTPQPYHLWGEGLLSELKALAAAGLTPLQALRSATVVPRDYFRSLPRRGSALGWAADFGTVEPGARADLLLIEGDPSRDLDALRAIRAVVAGGRLHDRAELDALAGAAHCRAGAAR